RSELGAVPGDRAADQRRRGVVGFDAAAPTEDRVARTRLVLDERASVEDGGGGQVQCHAAAEAHGGVLLERAVLEEAAGPEDERAPAVHAACVAAEDAVPE